MRSTVHDGTVRPYSIAQKRRWKLDPAELRENFLVRYLASLTPEQETELDAAVALDEGELDDAHE